MSEIKKFRAWDGRSKKMSFWTINDLCNHTDESVEKPSSLEDWTQFTGLLDKNDKEIYEGDIVKIDNDFKGEVKYSYGAFRVLDRGFHLFVEPLEIVGNVYENPEILNIVKKIKR